MLDRVKTPVYHLQYSSDEVRLLSMCPYNLIEVQYAYLVPQISDGYFFCSPGQSFQSELLSRDQLMSVLGKRNC